MQETPIPVQRLSANARRAYLAHLVALEDVDVRLRFGSRLPAPAIERYVEGIDFDRDALFGVHGAGMRLVGAAHLAFGDDLAELGLSVSPGSRRKGVGAALIEQVTHWAREHGCEKVYWLTQNGNTRARGLYDRVASATGFVHYEVEL